MSTTATAIDTTVANTILQQLGGNQFLAITGCKNLCATDNGLNMRLARNMINATHLLITLNSLDLYDMQYIRLTTRAGSTRRVLKRVNGIYGDMLAPSFEQVTGLYTRL